MNNSSYSHSTEQKYFQKLRNTINQQTAAMKLPNKIQFSKKPELHPYIQSILTVLPEFQPSYQSAEEKSQPIKWRDAVYQGQLKNGIPEGEGVLIRSNGVYMHGSFKGGISNGKFRIISPTKFVFEGNILNDMPEGQGEYQSQKTHFKGKFTIGLPTGEGQQTYNKGQWIFKGTYQMGVKKNGLLKWSKTKQNNYANYYDGPLDKQGKYDGIGTLKTKQGVYKGQFKNGLKQGKGQFIFLNGCKYKGNYKRNQKHGTGTFFNGNNTKWYQGEWHRDLPHGKGEFFTGDVSSGITDIVYGIRKDELPVNV